VFLVLQVLQVLQAKLDHQDVEANKGHQVPPESDIKVLQDGQEPQALTVSQVQTDSQVILVRLVLQVLQVSVMQERQVLPGQQA